MEIIKKGTIVTSKNPIEIAIKSTVDQKMYTKNNKKYIDLEIPSSTAKKIGDVHKLFNNYMTKNTVISPLEGNVLKVKIPFLRNRVTCKISGDKTLQEYKKGDDFTGVITFCGIWSVGDYCGPSWKLISATDTRQ